MADRENGTGRSPAGDRPARSHPPACAGPAPRLSPRRGTALAGDPRRLADVLPRQLDGDDSGEHADLGAMGPGIGLPGVEPAAVEDMRGVLHDRPFGLEEAGGRNSARAGLETEMLPGVVELVDPIVKARLGQVLLEGDRER